MTPNSKDAMAPPPAKRRVTRSVTFKLGLAEFSSVGFFSSHGTTCEPSQRAEVSAELYQCAYDEVEQAVRDYKAGIGQIVEEVLHPERTQAPEVSPFKVTQAAPTPDLANTGANMPSGIALNVVEKPATEIQHRQDEGKGVSEKLTEKSTAESVAPKRGRPPKAQQTSGIDAGASTASGAKRDLETTSGDAGNSAPVVKSPDKFQADDSDLPKEIGGTSDVPPGPDLKAKHEEIRASEAAKAAGPQLVPPANPPMGQWDRFLAVIDSLTKEGKRTKDNVDAAVKDFCRGFLNNPKLPKPPHDSYDPILPIIESLARLNPGVIMAEPQKSGLEAGVGWRKFSEHIEKWRPELREAATAVVLKKFPDNAMDLLDFLHNVAKLGELDKNLYVFLRTMDKTDAAIAMALRTTSEEHGKPMSEIMDGLDFGTATEKDILERISGVTSKPAQTETLWQE